MGDPGSGEVRVLLLGPDPPRGLPWGVTPVWYPLVRWSPVRGASRRAAELAAEWSDAIVFTSPRGPRALAVDAGEAGLLGRFRELMARLAVWAIGPRTAREVRDLFGLEPLVPGEYRGRSLAREIASRGHRRVLGLRGSKVIRDLEEELASLGVEYREVTVYTLERARADPSKFARAVAESDLAVLTSPFIARLYREALDRSGVDPRSIPVVVIGPSTGRAARSLGIEPLCVPPRYTIADAVRCGLRSMGIA